MIHHLYETYKDKNVLITGITGFKGSWLAYFLSKLGANVTGIALVQEEKDTAFHQLDVQHIANIHFEDIRKPLSHMAEKTVKQADYIFHFAAQALVGQSLRNPAYTFQTNVDGTIQLLELIKHTKKDTTLVNVASDRVYAPSKNSKHKETDTLGGLLDPYSLSKVWQNQLLDCYRNLQDTSKTLRLINVRTSNVIGGGDRGKDRLLTSIEDGYKKNTPVHLRNPHFTRQYIYILDCLVAYLHIGAYGKHTEYNVGSGEGTIVSVKDVLASCKRYYKNLTWEHTQQTFKEEGEALSVDTSRFNSEFPHVKPVAKTIDEVIDRTLQYNQAEKKKYYADSLIKEALESCKDKGKR